MIRVVKFEARTNLLSNSCWPLGTTNGIDEHAINSHFAIENGIIRSSTVNQGLLHLTSQNSPVCHFIFKDTRDMNINLIQMTAGQSDNNSHKSEHETATTLPE